MAASMHVLPANEGPTARPTVPSNPEQQLLSRLQSSINQETLDATFACGGSIPIAPAGSGEQAPGRTIKPVTIRFQDHKSTGHVLRFPDSTQLDPDALDALLRACQPATFGRGDQDVLDASYRKAGKLDTNAFDTNFSPYETGIIDSITQLLLPSLCGHGDYKRSVRAELYKLNVYSGPDGKFKAHVDTPRSPAQFGSLVVCLPVEHEGGQLVVCYGRKTVPFDWSLQGGRGKDGASIPQIHWAAFYSDCQHEVLPVTTGHRITLTYNLYATTGAGTLAGQDTGLDATKLPIYRIMKQAIEDPEFLSDGRKLAAYLAHAYAHTNPAINLLPHSLKGVDMVLYETARALGLHCCVRPIMEVPKPRYYRDSDSDNRCEGEDEDEDATIKAAGGVGDIQIGDSECLSDEKAEWFEKNWPYEALIDSDVVWLNSSSNSPEELALAYVAYGNESEMEYKYSAAALIIQVPPARMRSNAVKRLSV